MACGGQLEQGQVSVACFIIEGCQKDCKIDNQKQKLIDLEMLIDLEESCREQVYAWIQATLQALRFDI